MTIHDVRYVGQLHPDDTRTLWRVDHDGGHPLPPIAWAGDGQPGWGSAQDPTQADAELDAALAILADHLGNPAAAFDHAERLATDVLAAEDPAHDLVLPDTVLQRFADQPLEFRADATPLRDLLAATIADTGDPLDVAATGLGLDPAFAERVASGETTHLDLTEVRDLCSRLYVTPTDLWPPREADVIAQLWPTSQWPTAQPIDLTAPISAVPPHTTWHPALEPAATAAEVSVA